MADRKETLKYLNDLKEISKDTPFATLTDNYIEQVKATLNYGSGLGDREFKWTSTINDPKPTTTININPNTNPTITFNPDDLDLSLVLVTVDEDYTLQEKDFNNKTVIRANADTHQIITVPKPSEDYKGKSIVIRKTGNEPNTHVEIKLATEVQLIPADLTFLRRQGSTVFLVYMGDGLWEAYGELP